MGTVVFWVLFWALVIAAVIINAKNTKNNKKKRITELMDSFGTVRKSDKPYEMPDSSLIGGLADYKKKESENDFFLEKNSFYDLNLSELFGRVNRTLSSPGEEYLYYRFVSLNQDENVAKNERKLIDRLLSDDKLRFGVVLCLDELSKLKGHDAFSLVNSIKDAKCESNIRHIIFDFLLIAFICCIFISPGIGFTGFFVMLFVNISTYFSGKRTMEAGLFGFSYSVRIVGAASKISESLKTEGLDKAKELKKITGGSIFVTTKTGTTSNPLTIIFDYIKLIFHVDLIAYNSMLGKIKDYQSELVDLFILLGEIDCCVSVASFMKAMGSYCTPEFGSFSEGFDIKAMYHPLNRKPVPNDISVNRGIILTGSNASGKSTFLKAVGINVILSQNFGFALAEKFRAPIVKLYSSMAVNDNIVGEESYYVVEAKSLKKICDASCSFDNVFCLVDEVLRGTNTLERIAASSEILRFLSVNKCLCFAATHDGELTKLLADVYDMYYFTENIEDNVLVFPYKIQKGVAGEGKAIKLLSMLGYDKSVTDGAIQAAKHYKDVGKWEVRV